MSANTYLKDEEREILESATVGIAGAGGLGSNCAAHLVRAGLKRLVIADFDVVGADAVLANTAVAAAGDPVKMAEAFKLAVRAAEIAVAARPPAPRANGQEVVFKNRDNRI